MHDDNPYKSPETIAFSPTAQSPEAIELVETKSLPAWLMLPFALLKVFLGCGLLGAAFLFVSPALGLLGALFVVDGIVSGLRTVLGF